RYPSDISLRIFVKRLFTMGVWIIFGGPRQRIKIYFAVFGVQNLFCRGEFKYKCTLSTEAQIFRYFN
ncbi:MAG: hypothetical protein VSS75_027850, partial [Candidatus Parabeggiatoa sp.]|nr:hypothetical protein [Candidatus Parabeggiatoa sp.]